MREVRIDWRLVERIGVREWGLPTLRMPGKVWRSREHHTLSCMLPNGREKLKIETRPYAAVMPEKGDRLWMPMTWRRAMWQYVKAHPFSGSQLGPFLSVDDAKRNALLRKLGEQLAKADDIGARSIAHHIGEIAAYACEEF